jgi:hypothetical protein
VYLPKHIRLTTAVFLRRGSLCWRDRCCHDYFYASPVIAKCLIDLGPVSGQEEIGFPMSSPIAPRESQIAGISQLATRERAPPRTVQDLMTHFPQFLSPAFVLIFNNHLRVRGPGISTPQHQRYNANGSSQIKEKDAFTEHDSTLGAFPG